MRRQEIEFDKYSNEDMERLTDLQKRYISMAASGFSYKEIASELNCSLQNVYYTIDRAVKVLNRFNKPVGRKGEEWHLISPDGTHYRFCSLHHWAYKNCNLFGFEQSKENERKIASAISQAKAAIIGLNKNASKQYKGWTVIVTYTPEIICKMYQRGFTVNKIQKKSGYSVSKIRKILITNNLYKDSLYDVIKNYLEQGKNIDDIAELLGVSKKVVNSYMPYVKCIYNYNLSDNAKRIKKYKERSNTVSMR